MPAESPIPWGKPVDNNHPLRRRLTPEALVRAVLSLRTNNVDSLNRYTRIALAKRAKRPVRDLKRVEVQRSLVEELSKSLKKESKLKLVSDLAGPAAELARDWIYLGDSNFYKNKNQSFHDMDRRDMVRSWGFRLLPEDDPAFIEPNYARDLLALSGQTLVVQSGPPTGSNVLDAFSNFDVAWRKLAPKTEIVLFAQTGSDANNLLFDIAKEHSDYRRRQKASEAIHGRQYYEQPTDRRKNSRLVKIPPKPFTEASRDNDKEVAILVFDTCYAAGRGRLSGAYESSIGSSAPQRTWKASMSDYLIPSPTTKIWDPKRSEEINRLIPLEEQALQSIRDKVETSTVPIGGILIEPIVGSGGVLFYRPEFLTKLRALADELNILIFADEILTGGGRTGKFFAYEHYKDFSPDFVTFGKGLQVAGIAKVNGTKASAGQRYNPMVTRFAAPEQLLKATQILKRIDEGKLMQNANEVGDYMLARLRKNYTTRTRSPQESVEQEIRGKGLMIHASKTQLGIQFGDVDVIYDRFTPHLTLTKADVDQLFPSR